MLKRTLACVALTVLASVGVVCVPAQAAAARGCPDVQVLFARGTAETAPPLGVTGIAFERSLRAREPGKSIRVEAVRYRASSDFRDRLAFAHTFIDGVKALQGRVKQIAAACPSTDIVVGGYSQGAALAAYALSDAVTLPPSYAKYQRYAPKPLPAAIAPHVKAVVLFGPPSDRFLRDAGAPVMRVGRAYRGKTARYCAGGDTICNGARLGGPNLLHLLYPVNGMTDAAAAYVARRV
ncbi:cutinase [Gordonia spumicola]|uniref:Cutinase n=1 Tax=Gordonia spumicola TaxID=589161 RepID=A0A7I9V4Y3_9ACTN|nr:cutinase family protein [Gordonia spumicola]GEE00479.1 cutinase [Gordonia spumicola]